MATLNGNVVVRDERGEIVVLLAGTEVPEWAQAQIGDHLTAMTLPTGDQDQIVNDIPNVPVPEENPDNDQDPDDDGEEIESYTELTKDELKAEAKERGLSGYGSLNKDELVSLLEEDDAAQAEIEGE